MLLNEEAARAQPVLRQRHAPVPRGELFEPAQFVAVVMWLHLLWRRALADVVDERGKARGDIWRPLGSTVDDLHRVLPGIALGMVLGRLRLADEQRELRKGHGEDIRLLERAEEYRRPRRLQGAPQFSDDALLRLMLELCAAGVHVMDCLLRDGEAELRCLARCAQGAHRIFGEVMRDGADDLVRHIPGTVVRVNQLLSRELQRHAIHRRVPPVEVLLHRDRWVVRDAEAAVAPPFLLLLAREGHLREDAVNGDEVDREAVADFLRRWEELLEVCLSNARYHVVLVVRPHVAQSVAHPAADDEDARTICAQELCKCLFRHTLILTSGSVHRACRGRASGCAHRRHACGMPRAWPCRQLPPHGGAPARRR